MPFTLPNAHWTRTASNHRAAMQLGQYTDLERLGEGFLYRGRNSADGAVVGIKVLPAWRQSAEGLTRFEREVKVESAISHPNLARFLELGRATVTDHELVGSAANESGEADVFFLVREWVHGEPLEAVLEKRRLPLVAALHVGIEIAGGLAALHGAGVVHRNLNSSNVVLGSDGTATLVDFGLVKIMEDRANQEAGFRTASGQMLGTAGYMPPEQLKGEGVDTRSDLFSLGVLIHEAITGEKPFPTKDLLSYFHALDHEDPIRLDAVVPETPADVICVVAQLLSKRPEDRPSSATEVADRLAAALAS